MTKLRGTLIFLSGCLITALVFLLLFQNIYHKNAFRDLMMFVNGYHAGKAACYEDDPIT